MELFTGTDYCRNTMRIRFMSNLHSTYYCIPKRFDTAMNDLAGFDKLVVEFEFPRAPESAEEQAVSQSQWVRTFRRYSPHLRDQILRRQTF